MKKKALTRQNVNSFYHINDLCDVFSVSKATIKNWEKLKKITPDIIIDNEPCFSKQYINKMLKKIKSQASEMLKSRRNKTFVKGSFFYKDYISENSRNLKIVQDLLGFISEKNLILSGSEIKYLLVDCAIQMYSDFAENNINNLQTYLQVAENNEDTCFNQLLDDLITDKNKAELFIKNNPDLFCHKFVYEPNEDILGLLYLSLSDLADRKARGAYFTPTKIVQKIINNIKFSCGDILDPCCGTGNFLLQLPTDVKLENIHGNDIDPTSIHLTRINMALKFQTKDIDLLRKNFTVSDFLKAKNTNFYKYIIGNPPWGYKFSTDEIKNLSKIYQSANGKNVESYDVFVEKSLSILEQDGILSFVLPEAILNVKNHQPIRKYILNNATFSYLEYLGNMFDKVQCPSIILQLKKEKQAFQTLGMQIKSQNKEFLINTKRVLTSEVFNLDLNDQEHLIFDKIMNLPNRVYLKNNGIFALGIVTGDNKNLLSKVKKEKFEPIIKGTDISKFKIRTATNFIKFEPQNYQQVAPVEYYRTPEKLFYKFISNKLIFAYDNHQTLSLNSCNILIPKFKDLDIKYIMAVLNSSVAQFIFQKKFNSIKVLRSHLESLPLPKCDKKTQQQIINTVNKILETSNKSTAHELFAELDLIISKLYNLSFEEYSLIKNSFSYNFI